MWTGLDLDDRCDTVLLDARHDAGETVAGAALVAVADATAAGRDPRALGEVLIGRLRDAFLAVMKSPDRHLPAADLERADALGAQLGAAGLTRALEVLGEALVELSKKPDPRVVLEVALVRICRPDADRSYDAILDRLDRLERGVPVAPAASSPRATGPAASARDELAKATAPRSTRAPVKKATAAPTDASPRVAAPPVAAPAPETGAPPETSEPAGVRAADELQAEWSRVFDGLKGATKGMFRDGRFEASTDAVAVFTVPKGPPLDQLEKRRPEVEAALAAHFGRPVPIRLVVDSDASPAPASASAAPTEADDDVIDMHELEDAPSAGSGAERLAEAFPGAELVEE